jgi:hypothetical protein
MRMDASNIISNPTRATLFGRFYEDIVRKWLETQLGFTVLPGKPRIYWKDQAIPSISKPTVNTSRLISALNNNKHSRSHCTPDGFLEKDGKYFIWEAKNWPKWGEPIDNVLWNSAWLLAQKADYRKKKYDLTGIIFSWWSRPTNETVLLQEIRGCIAPLSFDIYYSCEILNQCIQQQPIWYVDIVKRVQSDVEEFFLQLLGKR